MPSFEQLRREVWEANLGIFRAGLVTMHSGNASGIDRRRGLVILKPSGMDYDKLRPADLLAVGTATDVMMQFLQAAVRTKLLRSSSVASRAGTAGLAAGPKAPSASAATSRTPASLSCSAKMSAGTASGISGAMVASTRAAVTRAMK